jgi:iron complex transport system substrate-binding protein
MTLAGIATGLLLLLVLALPAAASDYTLGVFGNANEDDTINMQDVTYTELIILEYRDRTDLADAKYDGKINMQDVTQIELVILGKEKELTILDDASRSVTVPMPVERFIPLYHRTPETMIAIGAKDMIVAIDRLFHERASEFGLAEIPEVSAHGKEINYEMILALDTDLVVLSIPQADRADAISEKLPTVAVVVVDCTIRDPMIPDLNTMGMLLGKDEEAGALIDWIEGYEGIVGERTGDLKLEEMPTFFYGDISERGISASTPGSTRGPVAEGCGGRNIATDLPGKGGTVDAEWLIVQNPDVIFIKPMSGGTGIGKTEADMEEMLTAILADRPELANINAVKDHRVYIIDYNLLCGPRWIIANCYFAKWLHPELFGDVDPGEMHREYLSEFHGLELEGTWAYPAPE